MRKTKLEKGITLVALIITIVVLLILAVVSIGAIRDSKIIGHSKDASSEYTIAQEKETLQLALSEWQLQKNVKSNTETFKSTIEDALNDEATVGDDDPGDGTLTVTFIKTEHHYTVTSDGVITKITSSSESSGGDDTVMPVATVGVVVTENSTINGESYSSSNPVIPKGFKAINVETEGHESKWDAQGGPQVSEGLVISDGTNEFVWIPVENGQLPEVNGTEPEVIGDDSDFLTQLTNEYNAMVNSVEEYKGFYVGRYELSKDETLNMAMSVAGKMPAEITERDINKWKQLYELCKTYQKDSVTRWNDIWRTI